MKALINLKKAREANKLTQKELGELVFLSSQSIYYYEKGEREPDLKTLLKLSKVLNVPIDYLLGASDKLFIDEVRDKLKQMSKEELIDVVQKLLDLVELISKK